MAEKQRRAIVNIEYEGDPAAIYSDAGRGEKFADVLARRLSRRDLFKGASASTALVLVPVSTTASAQGTPESASAASTLTFEPIEGNDLDQPVVASGYMAVPFLKWGDPLTADAPDFDPNNQTADAQAKQFGYNCDWMGFLPLPEGSDSSDHGLLVVNHEYTNPELMFPGYLVPNEAFGSAVGEATPDSAIEVEEFVPNPSKEIVDVELAAHGLSIVEIQRDGGGAWSVVRDSQYNRRITATTPMEITGAAAGSDLLKTADDTSGTSVLGTLNNCAGGITPWGTIVTGEENFQQYFANLSALPEDDPRVAMLARFGLNEGPSERQWETFYPRFDVAQEPNEAFRFGWGVEIDPYDPESTPKKRTALGRAKHEGHTSAIAPGGQVAIYSGDDERFEYAYKFVTAGSYDPSNREANMDLLDEGTLYVAKFNDDGSGEWLPLVHGENGLTEAAGFASQADVLINARIASDVLGATKMDRPEDFEANPATGKVYLVCTNNTRRGIDETNDANPRTNNRHGHIIEITEANDDHASETFIWEMFILAGDPAHGSTWYAGLNTDDFPISPLSSPDNLTFDKVGNIWISTDGNELGINDGLFAAPTTGEARGQTLQFFSAVPGAEVSGPIFTPDNSALFLSVQHPGEGGTYEQPLSTWPDATSPVRPSVVLIQSERDPSAPIGTSG
jgi:secreted PhoX family phosphatase